MWGPFPAAWDGDAVHGSTGGSRLLGLQRWGEWDPNNGHIWALPRNRLGWPITDLMRLHSEQRSNGKKQPVWQGPAPRS